MNGKSKHLNKDCCQRMPKCGGVQSPHTIHRMTTDPSTGADATILLQAAGNGDRDAADRLLPLLYNQLRQAAQRELNSERAGHTLSATALMHEAYLKLVGPREVPWAGRGHFYVAAAEAMRRILLDHAKARGREKRGGSQECHAVRSSLLPSPNWSPAMILKKSCRSMKPFVAWRVNPPKLPASFSFGFLQDSVWSRQRRHLECQIAPSIGYGHSRVHGCIGQ